MERAPAVPEPTRRTARRVSPPLPCPRAPGAVSRPGRRGVLVGVMACHANGVVNDDPAIASSGGQDRATPAIESVG